MPGRNAILPPPGMWKTGCAGPGKAKVTRSPRHPSYDDVVRDLDEAPVGVGEDPRERRRGTPVEPASHHVVAHAVDHTGLVVAEGSREPVEIAGPAARSAVAGVERVQRPEVEHRDADAGPRRPVETAATPLPAGPQTESPANQPSGTVIDTGTESPGSR